METPLRHSSRENQGALPKRFENFVVERPQPSSMFRTPVHDPQVDQGAHAGEMFAPVDNVMENKSIPGSLRTVNCVASPERHSVRSQFSKDSDNGRQLKELELEDQIEEDELKVSMERDRILAEKQLAALQIQQDLALKTEQRKMEYLKRKREREVKIREIKSCSSRSGSMSSKSSVHTRAPCRVTKWLHESESACCPDRLSLHEKAQNDGRPLTEPGVNEILSQAFKALQNRNLRDLPSFSGDVMEWSIFENEFRTSTEEYNLTDRDNLRRLNKALQGKARKTVEALLSSHENVEQIVRMLKSNFGRIEWVVANRLDALRNLENVKEGNIESFRTFYNAVIGTKAAMQNVKADNYLMNPELISHVADKLPTFSKQMWVRHKAALIKEGMIIDFNIFSRWLEDEMDNQLASLDPVFNVKRSGYQAKAKPIVLNVNSRDNVETATKCPLCSAKSHISLEKCEQFKKLSVPQRRSVSNSCKVCYICLKSDHTRRNCKTGKQCTVCKKNHHELVHIDEPSRSSTFGRADTKTNPSNVYNVNGKSLNTLLRVGKVKIRGPRGVAEIYALFDEGSSLSMMDAAVAKRIGLRGPTSSINYRWTNGISHKEENSMTLSFHISGPSAQAKWFGVNNVYTVENMDLPSVKLDVAKIKLLYPMLDEDKLSAIHDANPSLLIGSNNAGLIVPLKTVQYSLNGLQLTRCHLGWTIHGMIDPNVATYNDQHIFLCSDNDIELTDLVKKMYKVEDFGITGQCPKISDEDQRALDILNRTITRNEDRFEVGQVYKYNNFTFPDSKPQALHRLKIIEKKMDSDPVFAEKYCKKMQDYVDKGYARKLNPEELAEPPNTWYLPHFSVVSGEKFRIVMDAKAKSHGFSLNDLLLKGPDFVPPLVAILMRARRKKIAFVADIKEMFHQVVIRRADQDSQRFFWRGMDRSEPPSVYMMMVMIFGAVSSPSMAQFIKNFNAKELEEKYPGVERAVVEQHYVDDFFDCADTEEEAIELVQRVVKVHDHGGFKLVKFSSNSNALLDSLDPALLAEREENRIRVLGIRWDLWTDHFVFSLDFPMLEENFRTGEKVPTKRQLLKFMMSIFDPLSVLSPVMIQLKIIFQELWRLQSGWDDEMPDSLVPRWIGWLSETAKLKEIRFPRYYFPDLDKITDIELHAFCDASDKAFACVIYMVHRREGKAQVALVYAKSRVAPLKSQTVPRLEFQGCVLASQTMKVVQEELKMPVTKIYFWTDSKVCLSWLKTSQRLTAYIGSRVMKIKENGHDVDLWHWVPSQLNVADLATKPKFGCMQDWLRGPEFLRHNSTPDFNEEPLKMSPMELVTFHVEVVVDVCVDSLCCTVFENAVVDLPDITRFSDFNRLIRSTAYYRKIARIWTLPKHERPTRWTITLQDIIDAKNVWYRKVQSDIFSEEICSLKQTGYVKIGSRLRTYSPFLHDGIIRMRGRVQDNSKPFEVNNPVILPDNHPFSTLLIRLHHIANAHQGLETVINNIKQHYRILKTRSQVKKYTRSCVRCRELRGKPTVPQMGNLPPERTTPFVFPFTNTGIDYFGPLCVKVGRRVEKRWVVLFTCMTSRALHLEVVPSLDTNSCIMAIRCFMAIRGLPRCIMTDNGTNFTGADQELKKLIRTLDQPQIEDSLSVRGVEWKFIPPGAPHFGGCWERLVRSVKCGLRAMLRESHPTDLVLRTALCEVMNIINNRPLTHVPDDPLEPEPLSPNMLLLGRNNSIQFDHAFDEQELNCRAAYKHSQVYADRFWRRWVAEYRPELIRSRKWPDNRKYYEYCVGDLVMLVDESMHRGNWLKGVIEKVYYGPDRKVRTVSVKTAKSSYTRPVSKVVLLQAISSVPGLDDVADTRS